MVFFLMMVIGYCFADEDMASIIAAFAGTKEAKVGQSIIKWPNGNPRVEADIQEVENGKVYSGSLKIHFNDGRILEEIDVINGETSRKAYTPDGTPIFSEKDTSNGTPQLEINKDVKVPDFSLQTPQPPHFEKIDPSYCDKFQGGGKYSCLEEWAVKTRDISLCDYINMSDIRNSCTANCDNIPDLRDRCRSDVNYFINKDKEWNQYNQQKKTENDRLMQQWKSSLGINQAGNNSSTADSSPTPSEPVPATHTEANLSDCDGKSSQEEKNRCLLLRAVNAKDLGICKQIEDVTYEQRCENDVNSE